MTTDPGYISLLVQDQQQTGLWPPNDKGIAKVLSIKYSTGFAFPEAPNYKATYQDGPRAGQPKATTVQLIQYQAAGGGEPGWLIAAVGDAERIIASPDGKRLMRAPGAASTVTGISNNSNKAKFDQHLQVVAFQNNMEQMRAFSMDCSIIAGQVCEFLRIQLEERKVKTQINRPGAGANGPKKDPPSVVVINKFLPQEAMTQTTSYQAAPVLAPPPMVTSVMQPPMAFAPAPQAAPVGFPAAPSFPSGPGFPPPPPMTTPPPIVAAPAQAPVADEVTGATFQLIAQALSDPANAAGIQYRDLPRLLSACPNPAIMPAVLQRGTDQAWLKSLAAQGISFDGAIVRRG